MNRLPFEQEVVLALQAVALMGLCIRFLRTGLHRIYPYFFSYFVLALLQTAIPVFVPIRSRAYVNVWIASESLSVCWYALIVLEEYSKALREMVGVGGVARRYIQTTLALAVLLSFLLVSLQKTPATPAQYTFVCVRIVMSALLVFVLSSLVFLAYYPIPLSRNLMVYSIGFAVYLTAKTGAWVVGAMRIHRWNREINLVLVGASTACLLFWLLMLNRKGETKKVLLARRWSPQDEKRVLSQIQSINQSLLRTAKK